MVQFLVAATADEHASVIDMRPDAVTRLRSSGRWSADKLDTYTSLPVVCVSESAVFRA